MFGQNTVTSSWGNNQQNQTQGTSGFGQPSGFGSSNAFGSTNAFGQPQNQQSNPMFGNTSNAGGSTGFGAFGGANTGNNAFGAKPAGFGSTTFGSTGFGGGSTNAFGSTSGTTGGTTGSNIFGQASTGGTSAFGSNTFGAKPFGTATSQSENATGPVTTGSSNPPYAVFSEKDAQSPSTTIQYQAITCMPAYRGTSFEELRLQDYVQGRKNSASGGSTFGQTPAFNSTTGGTTNAFGQPQAASTPAFGSTTANTTPATGFGTFGQQSAQPATTGFGAFGQTQQTPAQNQPQQNTGFGAFGQTSQPSTGTNLFGGSSVFGQTQNKPSGFGGFGSGNTTGTNTFGTGTFGSGTGAFGSTQPQQTQQQQQQQQNPFGQNTAQPATTGFGAFGSTANTTNKPLFGQTNQTAQPTAAFGTFGQSAQQTQQQQQPSGFGSNLFGGNTTGTSLFGQNTQQPATQQQTTGFGTGAQTTGFGSNLFGNTQPQQQPQQQNQAQTGFGAFGKPAAPAGQTTGFGALGQPAPANTQTNLFGNTQNNAQGSTGFGTSLFSAKPPTALGTTQSTGLGNMFGSTNNQTASIPNQGALVASINQPIGANLPIFAMLPPGPRAVTLDQSQSKKKAPLFVDVPTRSPVPRVQLGGFTPANSKLRGFGSSTSSSALLSSSGLSFSSGKPNALSMSRQADSLTPDALMNGRASPSLGSGERRSVKKLILDKKVEATDLFSRSGSTSPGLRTRVSFSPALSVAARESAAQATSPTVDSPTPASRAQRTSNRFTAAPSTVIDGNVQTGSSGLKEGDYWSKPDLQTLMAAGHAELRCCKNLVVGRVGYGEIHFLEPVDLTGLSKLTQLYGGVIRFDDKECSVYPDIDESEKPPVGSYLNVPARVILLRCWANDKATREPVKDPNHPLMIKHLKKLKNMKDTKFEGFEAGEGKWTFSVEHF